MGFFTDALDTIGLGDVGSFVDSAFSSDTGGDPLASMSPDNVPTEDTGGSGGGFDVSQSDTGGSCGSSSGGGFLGKAATALGSAAISTAGSALNPIKVAQGVTPHYLNNVNPDSRSTPGKAQRAPVADPQAIWAQWERRLQQFVGK